MEPLPLLCDVLLPLNLPGLFTYRVPPEEEAFIQIGKRVVVQFAKRKIYTALVIYTYRAPMPEFKTKDILSVIDEEPIVLDAQLKFWDWISNYYMCNRGEVMKAALPAGLKLDSETCLSLHPELEDISDISETEEKILDYITNHPKTNINQLKEICGQNKTHKAVQNLLNKQLILVEEELKTPPKAKAEKLIVLSAGYLENEDLTRKLFDKLAKKKKQLALLMTWISMAKAFSGFPLVQVTRKDLLKKSGSTTAVLKTMVKNGIFNEQTRQVDRLQFSDSVQGLNPLSEAQQTALDQIKISFDQKKTVLLHGVTSSGKTEIFLQLIQQQLDKGKQVLYLLPEIALTTQIVNRLTRIFGNKVGVYHSKYSDAERMEIWNRLLTADAENHCPVILGVRSSVFLPFHNLGLIIVDEEHETTYKQFDPAPRYHARDAAIFLAHIYGANVLLGSATPSLESYQNTISGKYSLVELNTRYLNIEMPNIQLANLKEARHKKQMKAIFTPDLFAFIQDALSRKEQVILFQNRRGYSPILECSDCGWIPHCKNCDVSLTYHRRNNQLVCHYCGYTETTWTRCQQCRSSKLETMGIGTERIEDDVSLLFPDARVVRMDLDTTRGKNSYYQIIDDFENHRTDILVGTQMVSKGLDFNNVSLVGILNADSMLNYPDFRAHEKAFQMMAQVAGRAGRKNKQGNVIIQTSQPEHPVLKRIIENNYLDMFSHETEERTKFHYPPFYRLIRISAKHKDFNVLNDATAKLAQSLRNIFGNRVLGPEFPIISRIQDKYIKNILIKMEKDKSMDKIRGLIFQETNKLLSDRALSTLIINFDVDPI